MTVVCLFILSKRQTLSFIVTSILAAILFACRLLSMSQTIILLLLLLVILYRCLAYIWLFIWIIISSRLTMCHHLKWLIRRNLTKMLILLLNCFLFLWGTSCMILSSFSILCGIVILFKIIFNCQCQHRRRMTCRFRRLMIVRLGRVPSLCTIFIIK